MSEFVKNLQTVFELFGAIHAKRMFGGYGVYHDDLMFGLVADDVLYLKVDQQSEPDFIELNLSPFIYNKNGKPVEMSYYTAPEEIYDDMELARIWAHKAYDAALRNRKPKKR
jgi:DNA transformation protein